MPLPENQCGTYNIGPYNYIEPMLLSETRVEPHYTCRLHLMPPDIYAGVTK